MPPAIRLGWLLDAYLVDIANGQATNVTAAERVSFYNSVFFWPGDGAGDGDDLRSLQPRARAEVASVAAGSLRP